MSDFFNPTNKAAIDAFLANVKGLEDEWWIGRHRYGNDIIKEDSDGNVIEIDLRDVGITGSVDLTKLPPKLKKLYLHSNQLSGHLDLTQLPSSLDEVFLSNNSFTTIKIGNKLPKSLKELDVYKNELRGVIISPASVEHFDVDDNENLLVCKTQEEYDRVIAEMTGCVKMLRAARSSTHNAHEAFKVWNVAQQTINFIVSDVCLE